MRLSLFSKSRQLTAVLVCALALVPAVCSGQGASTGNMSVQDIANTASQAMAGSRYAEAIQLLNTLRTRLAGTDLPQARQMLEWAMYHLAVAHLETQAYDQAIRYCDEYLAAYPTGPFRSGTQMMRAESYAAQERWDEAVTAAKTALSDATLSQTHRFAAMQVIGEGLYRQDKWEEALEPLIHVFRAARDRAAQSQAAVMYTTCLVRLEKFDELVAFLPTIYRSSAAYDIELNVALIEGGDKNFDNDEFENALLFFRLVYFKPELIKKVEDVIARTKKAIENVFKGGLGLVEATAERKRLTRLVASYEEQLKQIQEYPDYDQDLMMRLGRTHLKLHRYWEALLLFRKIFDEFPEHPLAEQALYSAFATALEMNHHQRMMKEGYDYVAAYPGGVYWDIVTVTLTQLHIQREEWRKAIEIARKGLEGNAEHSMADILYYLIGYSHFQLEELDEALPNFVKVMEQYPTSAYVEPAHYWRAMTVLFQSKYPEALHLFTTFVDIYKEESVYYEDAFYRRGVSQYGTGDFTASESTLKQFVEKFPKSSLTSDALAMLGDIVASRRELDQAQVYYSQARASAVIVVQYTYAAFQSARVYELEGRFQEIIDLFREYLSKWGEKGSFTEAYYWIGTAQSRMGRSSEALETFFEAIVKYGDNPKHYGIDMMLRDLAYEKSRFPSREQQIKFMDRLFAAMEKARAEKRRTLELRLIAMFAEVETDENRKKDLLRPVLREANIKDSGPLTLIVMGEAALASGQKDLARKIYEHMLTMHGESDLTLDAYKAMSDFKMAEGKFAEAEKLLREITSRFASMPEASWATKRLGDALREQKKFGPAIETYTTVLSVREWRGELWPESLYWCGICKMELGEFEPAFAYFQRVYVLYEGYPEWTARAYLKSAECLLKLNKAAEAMNTYREMLGKESLAKLPEFATAKAEFEKLGGRL